ncbi:unnamed protein product [marine sediment metagenome]|uniref:Uncharacterized protein n=1 Tax=marine sediment metagenome TaxID=412755 RepID=X1GKK3_9ZZZZ
MVQNIKKFFDETFGSPEEALKTMRGVSEALTSLDQAKLRLLRSVLAEVGKVKGSPEELEAFLEIMRLITNASMEQLTAIRDITSNLIKLGKLLPKDMSLQALPLKEIIEEVGKGG